YTYHGCFPRVLFAIRPTFLFLYPSYRELYIEMLSFSFYFRVRYPSIACNMPLQVERGQPTSGLYPVRHTDFEDHIAHAVAPILTAMRCHRTALFLPVLDITFMVAEDARHIPFYFFDSRGIPPPPRDNREHVRRATARYILKSKWNEKAGLLGPGRVVRITEKVTSNLPHNQVDFFFFVFVSPVHCLSFLLPVTAISHSGDTCCIS
ncbi:hypothetical protein EDD15DRAFT_2316428, partial [Pisolithus albus]